ncbi:MAG: S24 family peptidase [Gemmatimonadota bacterium]|jgi:repressor LexA
MSASLNDIERRILDYMVSYLRENTYQPSIREIGEEFGIKSTKTVSEHLQALAEKGFLERDPSRSRGVKILGVDLSPDAVTLPCYPALPDDGSFSGFGEGAETYLTLDRRLAGVRGSFLLRARGDELLSMGAQNGDYVLVEPVERGEPLEGSVIVARPAGVPYGFFRVTRDGGGLVLEPLRSGGDPWPVEDPDSLRVAGRVGGIFRHFDGPGATSSFTAH